MAVTAAPEHTHVPLLARPNAVLILVSTAHAITHLYSALFPLIYPILQREWGFSYGALGSLLGVTQFLGGLLQLAFGFIGRYVPRNVLLGVGNILLGLTAGLTALTTTFGQFAVLRVGASVANAAQHPVGNAMIADRFPRERRGSALAVNFAGGNVGTLVVPVIAVALIAAVGWQNTLWIFMIPGVVVGLLLIVAMPDHPVHAGTPIQRGSVGAQLVRLVKRRNAMILVGASSVAAGGRGLGVLFTFIPLYLANGLGMSQTAVGLFYTVMLVGSVIGPMIAGSLSDRFGRKIVIIAVLGLSTLLTISLATVEAPSTVVLAVVLFLMGAIVFSESPLIQSFMADSIPAGERDLSYGFYFAMVYAAGAVWVWLIGALIDRAGFGPAWWLVASSYLGAALLVLASREQADSAH